MRPQEGIFHVHGSLALPRNLADDESDVWNPLVGSCLALLSLILYPNIYEELIILSQLGKIITPKMHQKRTDINII